MGTKVKKIEELLGILERIRKEMPGKKIVTTNGAFDLMHAGHLHSLEKAKSFGDILIVGLNSDDSVRRYKSPLRPIISQEYRAKMLEALETVDYVCIFDEDDPRVFLSAIKPDFHVKSKSGYKGIEKEAVESNGGKIVLIDDIQSLSTTEIITKIIEINDSENSN